MNDEEISDKMFEATKKIYDAVKGLPTIIIVGLLDVVKTDFLLNYHVRQDGIIAPIKSKNIKKKDSVVENDK